MIKKKKEGVGEAPPSCCFRLMSMSHPFQVVPRLTQSPDPGCTQLPSWLVPFPFHALWYPQSVPMPQRA